MYSPQCPRCGRKIHLHEMYCRSCTRDMGRPVNFLEKRRSLHLVYTVVLVLANIGLVAFLFWRSYM